MFTRPFSVLLILFLSTVNFAVMLFPFYLLLLPFYLHSPEFFTRIGTDIVYLAAFVIASLMLLYLFLDLVFGFTVRRLTRNTVPIEKVSSAGLSNRNDLVQMFMEVKALFAMPGVELYLDPDLNNINAYAVGSLRKKAVVVTAGLLARIRVAAANDAQFADAIRGILAHEMSHLINKDFLPALLMLANENATKMTEKIVWSILVGVTRVFSIIPFAGNLINELLISLYRLFSFIISAYYRIILRPISRLLQKYFSRAVEYRCDREAAHALGGHCVATGLSFLGKSGFWSVFSTHPKTKYRIKRVADVAQRSGTIRAGLITRCANIISLVGLIVFCLYFAYKTDEAFMGSAIADQLYYAVMQCLQSLSSYRMW